MPTNTQALFISLSRTGTVTGLRAVSLTSDRRNLNWCISLVVPQLPALPKRSWLTASRILSIERGTDRSECYFSSLHHQKASFYFCFTLSTSSCLVSHPLHLLSMFSFRSTEQEVIHSSLMTHSFGFCSSSLAELLFPTRV